MKGSMTSKIQLKHMRERYPEGSALLYSKGYAAGKRKNQQDIAALRMENERLEKILASIRDLTTPSEDISYSDVFNQLRVGF